MCHYGRDVESTSEHFLLYCLTVKTKRQIIPSTLNDIDQKLFESKDSNQYFSFW